MAKAPILAPRGIVVPDDNTSDAEAARNSQFLGANEQGAPSVGKTETIADLQARIAQMQGETELKVEVGMPAAAVVASGTTAPVGMPKTVRIILEEGENMPPTGQPISLNGKAYIIRPGVPVDVPLGILEILDNAIASKPILDPQSMKIVGHRDVHRFPYRLVRRDAA